MSDTDSGSEREPEPAKPRGPRQRRVLHETCDEATIAHAQGPLFSERFRPTEEWYAAARNTMDTELEPPPDSNDAYRHYDEHDFARSMHAYDEQLEALSEETVDDRTTIVDRANAGVSGMHLEDVRMPALMGRGSIAFKELSCNAKKNGCKQCGHDIQTAFDVFDTAQRRLRGRRLWELYGQRLGEKCIREKLDWYDEGAIRVRALREVVQMAKALVACKSRPSMFKQVFQARACCNNHRCLASMNLIAEVETANVIRKRAEGSLRPHELVGDKRRESRELYENNLKLIRELYLMEIDDEFRSFGKEEATALVFDTSAWTYFVEREEREHLWMAWALVNNQEKLGYHFSDPNGFLAHMQAAPHRYAHTVVLEHVLCPRDLFPLGVERLKQLEELRTVARSGGAAEGRVNPLTKKHFTRDEWHRLATCDDSERALHLLNPPINDWLGHLRMIVGKKAKPRAQDSFFTYVAMKVCEDHENRYEVEERDVALQRLLTPEGFRAAVSPVLMGRGKDTLARSFERAETIHTSSARSAINSIGIHGGRMAAMLRALSGSTSRANITSETLIVPPHIMKHRDDEGRVGYYPTCPSIFSGKNASSLWRMTHALMVLTDWNEGRAVRFLTDARWLSKMRGTAAECIDPKGLDHLIVAPKLVPDRKLIETARVRTARRQVAANGPMVALRRRVPAAARAVQPLRLNEATRTNEAIWAMPLTLFGGTRPMLDADGVQETGGSVLKRYGIAKEDLVPGPRRHVAAKLVHCEVEKREVQICLENTQDTARLTARLEELQQNTREALERKYAGVGTLAQELRGSIESWSTRVTDFHEEERLAAERAAAQSGMSRAERRASRAKARHDAVEQMRTRARRDPCHQGTIVPLEDDSSDDETPEPKESPTRPPKGLRKELSRAGAKHKRPRAPSPRASAADRQALFDELLQEIHD